MYINLCVFSWHDSPAECGDSNVRLSTCVRVRVRVRVFVRVRVLVLVYGMLGLPMSKVIKSMKIKSRVATPGDGEEPEERKKKKKKKKKGKKDDAASPGGGYGFESRAVKF